MPYCVFKLLKLNRQQTESNTNGLSLNSNLFSRIRPCCVFKLLIQNRQQTESSDALEQRNLSSLKEILGDNAEQKKALDLLLFDFNVIAKATNDFSCKNTLGKGGFGSVYRGKLPEGQEVAVKRLSKGSGQGIKEFKNEVLLISKVQHRNLVRLLGYCIHGKEKLLAYELMPNKSLDAFIFDPTKHGVLNWEKRYHIVEGIARGLLYLHRDSRLKIIHRDLKASNILLDEQFNPKISDFGLARTFGGDQVLDTTGHPAGTYGYMSPEYAMRGQYSERSDVFSFGVLLLEVVSGKRNNSFHDEENSLNLLGYAWKLWNENKARELIDPLLVDSYAHPEALRCIQVGLLCVQEYPEDRPIMGEVVSMLNGDRILSNPKQVAFLGRMSTPGIMSDTEQEGSVNNLTLSEMGGR